MPQLELYRYNPGQCSPEEIEATFVAREDILESIVKDLRSGANVPTNQHFLIIGPRGIGKTNLLLMLKRRVLTDDALRGSYLPVETAEEEYSITSLRDFVAKILALLSEIDPEPEHEAAFELKHVRTSTRHIVLFENQDTLPHP